MNGFPNDQLRAEQAFVRLWAGLRPDIAKTFWPRESVHPEVVRVWQHEPPMQEFHTLQQRVRTEWARQRAEGHGPWFSISGYCCAPVLKLPPLCRASTAMPFRVVLSTAYFNGTHDITANEVATPSGESCDRLRQYVRCYSGDAMAMRSPVVAVCAARGRRFVVCRQPIVRVDRLAVVRSIEVTPALCRGAWKVAR